MLLEEIKNNNGHIDLKNYVDHLDEYEKLVRKLIKNKDYVNAYLIINACVECFKDYSSHPIVNYRPGYDYICPYYILLKYAKMNEKGVKGVVKKNTKESTYAYVELLKRYEQLPNSIQKKVIGKSSLLLKYAYPDLNDLFSQALTAVGDYYFKRGEYEKAFLYFKKGADFDADGRQITFPFYLIGINQDRVADMYRDGKGVKQNLPIAIKYYKKCASNCGREHHPKLGDIYLERGNYVEAFWCYTERNSYFRYDTSFMYPNTCIGQLKIIFDKLSHKKLNPTERYILGTMYYGGIGCEKDLEKAQELLTEDEQIQAQIWASDYNHISRF